jgi:hypothetical protein
MKVYISNYRNHWLSPYTILDYVFFWTDWSKCSRNKSLQSSIDQMEGKSTYIEPPAWVDKAADKLEPISRAIQKFLDFFHPRIQYVKINRWDTWGMDHTLATIALPMLRQLQETKHGSPLVDDDDVPDHLKSTAAPAKANEWDVDDNHFLRWDWVLGEMIFAFEKKVQDHWTDEFHSGQIDLQWVPVDQDGNEVAKGQHKFYMMKDGPNHTHVVDTEGMQAVQDRITNGFRLFGKYYEALWD